MFFFFSSDEEIQGEKLAIMVIEECHEQIERE
jgi:hypothetical protein